MTEEEKKTIDDLTMRAITSSVEAPDYPNCIVMKKDLITLLNLIQKQELEINKLNNVIDRMAEEYSLEANTDILDICACCNYNNEDCHGDYCKEALINYFTNKVEEDK